MFHLSELMFPFFLTLSVYTPATDRTRVKHTSFPILWLPPNLPLYLAIYQYKKRERSVRWPQSILYSLTFSKVLKRCLSLFFSCLKKPFVFSHFILCCMILCSFEVIIPLDTRLTHYWTSTGHTASDSLLGIFTQSTLGNLKEKEKGIFNRL